LIELKEIQDMITNTTTNTTNLQSFPFLSNFQLQLFCDDITNTLIKRKNQLKEIYHQELIS